MPPRSLRKPLRLAALALALLCLSVAFVPVTESAPPSAPAVAATPAPGELRELAVPAKDIIFDPNTQTLFTSAESDAGMFGQSITPINPVTGEIGTPVRVGPAGKMAISDNGQYIYVSLDFTRGASIRRFDVATRTPGMEFPLRQDTLSTEPLRVEDIAVMPGNPEVIAVARSIVSAGDSAAGTAIYDNGVQRGTVAPGGSAVEFSSSPSVLYGYNPLIIGSRTFSKMMVGPCGVAETNRTNRLILGDFKYDNAVIYSPGSAIDAESGNLLGSFITDLDDLFSSRVATDSKAGRVYILTPESPRGTPPRLRVFDMRTFQQLGELQLPGLVGKPLRLVRWGAHGLAFNMHDDLAAPPNSRDKTYILQHELVAGPTGNFTPAPTPTASTLSFTGQITDFGDGLSGVQINVSGSFNATATTDANGNFTVNNIPHCSDFTITPVKENYTFDPPSVHLANPGVTRRLTFNARRKEVFFSRFLQFEAESKNVVQMFVVREGDLSEPASVEYETVNGTASDRSDYTAAFGTLRFAVGESVKTLNILITDDALVEGQETFKVRLKNPSGAMFMPPFDAVTVTITDNDTEIPATNPLLDPGFFVRRQYQDFLNRDPSSDLSGFEFWKRQITSCDDETDAQRRASCLAVRRINVSAAFFLSIEFQQTGYFVHRFYAASYAPSQERPRGLPRFNEFLRDTQEIGRGVIVGADGWEEALEQRKEAFAQSWVSRPEFIMEHPLSQTAEQFVDSLFRNAASSPTAEERAAAVAAFGGGGDAGRASALRKVVESRSVAERQRNPAFVLMQYFGYLRRNPDEAPDGNFDGYQFWLDKLNQFNGNFVSAEMVKAFLISTEYQQRFGPANFNINR